MPPQPPIIVVYGVPLTYTLIVETVPHCQIGHEQMEEKEDRN